MRWKLAIGIAALVMVTLVVAVYLILASYDYNKLKPWAAQAVRDATGRELTLGGDRKCENRKPEAKNFQLFEAKTEFRISIRVVYF